MIVITMMYTIAVAPSVVIAPDPSDPVPRGSTISMACTAYGVPLPTSILWYQGSTLLTNDSRVTIYTEELTENGSQFLLSILEICSLTDEDAGSYSCYVETIEGNDTATFNLDVGMWVCVYV